MLGRDSVFHALRAVEPDFVGNFFEGVFCIAPLKDGAVQHVSLGVALAAGMAIFLMVQYGGGVAGDNPARVAEVRRQRFQSGADSERFIAVIVEARDLVEHVYRLVVDGEIKALHKMGETRVYSYFTKAPAFVLSSAACGKLVKASEILPMETHGLKLSQAMARYSARGSSFEDSCRLRECAG